MQQLAEVTASSASNEQQIPSDPERPLLLSPSIVFGWPDEDNDAPADKAVTGWMAIACHNLDHFGTLVGIGGAAIPHGRNLRRIRF
jgi:hypothetical protein